MDPLEEGSSDKTTAQQAGQLDGQDTLWPRLRDGFRHWVIHVHRRNTGRVGLVHAESR